METAEKASVDKRKNKDKHHIPWKNCLLGSFRNPIIVAYKTTSQGPFLITQM